MSEVLVLPSDTSAQPQPTMDPEPVYRSANSKTQCSYWALTVWDLTALTSIPWPEVPNFKYLIFQKEKCPSTGKLHHQAFLAFDRSKRFSVIRKLLGDAKCDIHRMHENSTPASLRAYCSKEDTRVEGPWECGEWTASMQEMKRGKRTDLDEVKEKLKSGVSMKRIADEHFTSWCRYNKAFKLYESMNAAKVEIIHTKEKFNGPELDLRKPCIIIGPTNIGKTGFAKSHFTNPLLVSHIDDLQTLDKDHDGIIFDDNNYTHWPPTSIIHLVDIEEDRSIHNRYTNARLPRGTKRIFTHNRPIEEWLIPPTADESQKSAIIRRINVYTLDKDLRIKDN